MGSGKKGSLKKNNNSTALKKPPPPNNQEQNSGILGNIVGSMASGFGFGTGIEVAKKTVDSIFGYSNTEKQENEIICNVFFQLLQDCNNNNNYDNNYVNSTNNCQVLYDDYKKHCVNN